MTSTQSQESPGTVIGNHTKKYTAKNPAIRYLTERWVARLDGMVEQISHAKHPATNPLEVGAGEAGACGADSDGGRIENAGVPAQVVPRGEIHARRHT